MLNVSGTSPAKRTPPHSKPPRRRLDRRVLAYTRGYSRVPNDPNTLHMGSNFLEQSQPFRTHFVVDIREPGHIAARLCQACYKATANGIGNLNKYDRHSPRRLLQSGQSWGARRKDDVRRQCHQFRCSFRNKVEITSIPTILNLQIAAVGPAQLLQFFDECRDPCQSFGIIFWKWNQDADASHPFRLLRVSRNRPCRRRANKPEEISPPHCRPRGSDSQSYQLPRTQEGVQCPLWVISGHLQRTSSCPLYPRKRHQTRHMGMSARAKSRLMPCSKKDRYSITLSARASTLDGNARPSALAATEERSIRSACHSARIRKCAARHLAPGGARDELNAPPLCSTGKESA